MSNRRRMQNSADAHWFVYKLGVEVPLDVTHALVHHSVEVLPEDVFEDCEHLKEVEIQEGLRKIGAAAFLSCWALEYVTLPSTLKKICEDAFCWCKSLKEIILPEGLTEIGNSGFRECHSLKRICVPSTVTTIGDYAFHRCTSLKAVRLVDGIRTIGKAAFSGCDSLDDIMLPATLAEICKCVFTAGYGGGNSVTPQRVTFRDGILAVGAEASPEYRDYELVVLSSKAFVVSKRDTGNYIFKFVTEMTIPKTESGQVVIASEGFNLLRPTDMPEVERTFTHILGGAMLSGWNEKRERLRALVAPYEVRYKTERTTLLKLCLWKKVDANGAAFIVPQVLSYL